MLKEFKTLVAEAASPIEAFYEDYQEVCRYYNYDISRSYSRYDLLKIISEKIIDEIKPAENAPIVYRTILHQLRQDFIDRYILLGEDPQEALEVISTIWDSCRHEVTKFVPLSESDKWRRAIMHAKSYRLLSDTYKIDLNNIRHAYPEYVDRAYSMKSLVEMGCNFSDDGETISLDADVVIHEIEEDIKKVGGLNIASFIFAMLRNNNLYSALFDRFLIVRHTNGIEATVQPQIPIGYLLNLSVKYPYYGDSSQGINFIKTIVSKSVTACNAMYGAQHYSIWAYISASGERMHDLLRDLALWDSIFSIPQVRDSNIIEMCEFLVKDVPTEKLNIAFPFGAANLFAVIKAIFSSIDNGKDDIRFFSADKDFKSLELEQNVLVEVLDFISHNERANADYTCPDDMNNCDYFLKPLIKEAKGKYIIVNKSWNAGAIFEVIASALRPLYKGQQFDSFIGIGLEKFVQSKLVSKGVTFTSGKYSVNHVDGEADIVVETEEVISLFELKKKVLTRKAKSGIDVNILIDLSDSIIAASIQSARTELLVRENCQLTLTNENGTQTVLEHRGRKFEHVGVTQMEFGGLHDRQIMSGFMKALLRFSFHPIKTDNKTINEKFDELNENREELVKQYNAYYAMSNKHATNPYFDNWFISYNQLLEIIRMSNGNSQFYENLTTAKHSHSGTFDFYAEFLISKETSESPFAKYAKERGITFVHLR